MQGEFDYLELLESAKSVLRGRHPSGTLARIVDLTTRRGLAAEFMHRDASTLVPVQWQGNLRAALAGVAVVCARAKASPYAGLPDGFEPVCWYSWRSPRSVSEETVRMRRQAANNFTNAMFQAVWTAHSAEPEWRVRSACEVLDAVDCGGRVIAPLARFLRVSRKAIKLSAKCHIGAPLTHYGRMRRWMRALQALRAAGMPTSGYLPEVDLAQRAAHASLDVSLSYVGNNSAYFKNFKYLEREVVLAEWRGAIRELRAKAAWMRTRISSRRAFELSSDWTAHSLVTMTDVRREGREMGHCVAVYADDVVEGLAQVFSLRCAHGGDRMTAVYQSVGLEAWRGGGELECVDFAARENGPIPVTSLLALIELSQRLEVSELKIGEKFFRMAGCQTADQIKS